MLELSVHAWAEGLGPGEENVKEFWDKRSVHGYNFWRQFVAYKSYLGWGGGIVFGRGFDGSAARAIADTIRLGFAEEKDRGNDKDSDNCNEDVENGNDSYDECDMSDSSVEKSCNGTRPSLSIREVITGFSGEVLDALLRSGVDVIIADSEVRYPSLL